MGLDSGNFWPAKINGLLPAFRCAGEETKA